MASSLETFVPPREFEPRPSVPPPGALPPQPGIIAPYDEEAAARRDLREQIARLESELATLSVGPSAQPARAGRRRGPRLLSLADLEELRDGLSERVSALRRELDQRGEAEEEARRSREQMLIEPKRHRWMRVSNTDIGEPGCTGWQVAPRLGLLGMLMNWWVVKISSGCPLASG